MDFVSFVHGNAGFLRPCRHVVQAEASIHSVIQMNADLMPHQMKSLDVGRQDVRIVLPSELNWKRMQEDVNEVISFGFSGFVFILLLLSGDCPICIRHLYCLQFCVVPRLFLFLFCLSLLPNRLLLFYQVISRYPSFSLFFISFLTFCSYREISR